MWLDAKAESYGSIVSSAGEGAHAHILFSQATTEAAGYCQRSLRDRLEWFASQVYCTRTFSSKSRAACLTFSGLPRSSQ